MPRITLSDRLVEVIADLGPSTEPHRYRHGSGCRVAGHTVLTSAHVVAGAQAVSIRGTDKEEHAAEAVTTTLPEHVTVVAYFLSRREPGADGFLHTVVPQLAELVRGNSEPAPQPSIHSFYTLWEHAAGEMVTDDRHLLLVVDGLDEDRRVPGTCSVACLLPRNLPERAHVLVSSRPHPGLPLDIADDHPIKAARPELLDAFAGADELTERLAQQEIDRLKDRGPNDQVLIDLLGFLTAASGPLTVEELATLTARRGRPTPGHLHHVSRLVEHDVARSLRRVGSGTGARFQFAHPHLRLAAQADEIFGHPDFSKRIRKRHPLRVHLTTQPDHLELQQVRLERPQVIAELGAGRLWLTMASTPAVVRRAIRGVR